METRELELSKLKISKYFNAIQIDKITIKQDCSDQVIKNEESAVNHTAHNVYLDGMFQG